jgi:hypothetical protein
MDRSQGPAFNSEFDAPMVDYSALNQHGESPNYNPFSSANDKQTFSGPPGGIFEFGSFLMLGMYSGFTFDEVGGQKNIPLTPGLWPIPRSGSILIHSAGATGTCPIFAWSYAMGRHRYVQPVPPPVGSPSGQSTVTAFSLDNATKVQGPFGAVGSISTITNNADSTATIDIGTLAQANTATGAQIAPGGTLTFNGVFYISTIPTGGDADGTVVTG